MRCLYCLEPLELLDVDVPHAKACGQCEMRYAVALLTDLDTEQIIGNPRYGIHRIPPTEGSFPMVEITDFEAALS